MSNIASILEFDIILSEVEQECDFSIGKQEIRSLEPNYQPLIIQQHQRLTAEAFQCVLQYESIPLHGLRDIREILIESTKDRVLTSNELLSVLQVLRGIRQASQFDQKIPLEHPELHDYISTLVLHPKVEEMIAHCINEYGEVEDHASSELMQIRRELRGIDGEISRAIQSFVASHASSVVDSIVTERNGRAVVLVKVSEKNAFGGIVYGDSASGQASYVEPASVVAINNRKQQLLTREQEEVQRILMSCSKEVKGIAQEVIANLETCGILDAVFAKVKWGLKMEGCIPTLTTDKSIEIIQARHPLISKDSVVSNDYRLGEPQRMLLITGPNTGGKTVSLKSIGLFVLMTYCGIPLPAKSATIPFFDRVFVDIGDGQSVVSSLSSFSAHIQKIAEMIEEATENSLVLLDEIGSGTDPREGESLAIAVLNELRDRKTMTIATTHYSRLKNYGKRHEDILLASVEFDMEKLAPTYRYLEGFTGQSNALEVAERYGLRKNIIQYARFLKNQAKTEEDTLLERLEYQLQENQKLQEELQRKLDEANDKDAKLQKQLSHIEREKNKILDQAQDEADQLLEQTQEEADEILKKLREFDQIPYHEALQLKEQLQHVQQEEKEPIDLSTLQIGDVVELVSSGQIGEVLKIGKKYLTIRINHCEMQVSFDSVRKSDQFLPKKEPEKPISVSITSGSNLPLECNIIGYHVDEAMEELSRYMDQVKLAKYPMVRIIHGDGSGALRKAVHKFLSSERQVEEFHLGIPQEGGTGATIVKMKE